MKRFIVAVLAIITIGVLAFAGWHSQASAGSENETARHSQQGAARAPLQVTEWTVPWEKSRPRDPYVDAHGRVWFVGQEGNYVAYLEPSSGKFKRYEIAKGTNPHNLVVDAAGRVWFSGNRNGTIGWLDAETGKATVHP